MKGEASQPLPRRKEAFASVIEESGLVNRPPPRLGHRLKHRVAYERVPKAELVAAALDEDALAEQLLGSHCRVERKGAGGPGSLQFGQHAGDLLGDKVVAEQRRQPRVGSE